MAHYYDCSDGYLKKHAFKPAIIFLYVTFFSILVLILMYYNAKLTKNSLAMSMVFLTGVYIYNSSNKFARAVIKYSRSYFLGWFGERKIGKILQKLPNDFHVFYDVKLPEESGNVDYVVIGPPGIFAIEVKYYKRSWSTHGQHFRNKKQTNNGAKNIHNYLVRAGIDIPWVKAVLVRAHTKSITHTHDKTTDVLGYKNVENYFINMVDKNINDDVINSCGSVFIKQLKCKNLSK